MMLTDIELLTRYKKYVDIDYEISPNFAKKPGFSARLLSACTIDQLKIIGDNLDKRINASRS